MCRSKKAQTFAHFVVQRGNCRDEEALENFLVIPVDGHRGVRFYVLLFGVKCGRECCLVRRLGWVMSADEDPRQQSGVKV